MLNIGRTKIKNGLIVTLLSILIVTMSILLITGLKAYYLEELRLSVIIKNEDSERFQWFVDNTHGDALPEYLVFDFWNMTNVESVVEGGKPNYHDVGSFFYKKVRVRENISFSSWYDQKAKPNADFDHTLVSFEQNDYFLFHENGTVRESDLVTNFNPAYLKLVNIFGTEEKLALGLLSALWRDVYVSLQSRFTDDAISFYGSQMVIEERNRISMIGNTSFCEKYSTSNISSVILPNIKNFTVDNCQQIFFDQNKYSMINSNFNINLFNLWVSKENHPEIIEQLNLSQDQIDSLVEWINSVRFLSQIDNYIFKKFDILETNDLLFLQISRGILSKSLKEFYPNLLSHLPSIEINSFITVSEAKELFLGQYGIISSPKNMISLHENFFPDLNIKSIRNKWKIEREEDMVIIQQYFKNIIDTLSTLLLTDYSDVSGLIVTRTISEWIFGFCDPLMTKIFPEENCFTYLKNNTKTQTTVYTGVSPTSMIYFYYDIDGGNKSIFGELINGSSDEKQFVPFYTPINMTYFDSDYQKNIVLHPEESEVKQIGDYSIYKYVYDKKIWFSHEKYHGFSYIGPKYDNLPFYLSRPYFHGAPKKYLEMVNGIIPPVNNSMMNPLFSEILLEHVSARSFTQNICNQLNLYPDISKFKNYKLQNNTMWPIYRKREYYEMNTNTTKPTQTLIDIESKNTIITPVSYVLSAAVMFVSIIIVLCGIRDIKHGNPKTIQYNSIGEH